MLYDLMTPDSNGADSSSAYISFADSGMSPVRVSRKTKHRYIGCNNLQEHFGA
jgi:hypothetical protein